MAALTSLAAVSGVIAAYFAGVTAVANITTVYLEYRRQHPKSARTITGARRDYVKLHCGYDINIDAPCNEPEQCMFPKRSRSRRFKSWASKKLTSTCRPLGGDLTLNRQQEAPDTNEDKFVGLNTGKQPMYDKTSAKNHWRTFHDGSACWNDAAPTIAVVNWRTEEITMFVQNSKWKKGMYFRNYYVSDCDMDAFAEEYRSCLVFSGKIVEGNLMGTNSSIVMAEDDRTCGLKSTNSWNLLGIRGETGDECMFLEMVRAAVFGLVECLYEDPTMLNVDMIDGGNGKEFVHVDIPDGVKLTYKPDNYFSVFAFNASEYATDRVLVG